MEFTVEDVMADITVVNTFINNLCKLGKDLKC